MARFVLVHGAFGGTWAWGRVAPLLRDAGHEAEVVELPGAGSDPTPVAEVTLSAYAQRICMVLGDGPPALLVGQSMGGMAITQAAARCPELVAALAYVAAFLPVEGESLVDLAGSPEGAGDGVQSNIVVEGDPPVARMPVEAAPEVLYNCASAEQAAWAARQLGPQPVAPFTQPLHVGEQREAFDALPRAYVTCLQDRAIRPPLQRLMYTRAGCDPVIELDTDHSPWLSRTEDVAAALDRIADALT
jgi:pimeloyl-ACP methyl ester carboxylesterase